MIRMKIFWYIVFIITSLGVSFSYAQKGDEREKQKELLNPLNWKKWSPGVVPVYSADESLKLMRVATGFKVELVASEPMVKDPVFVDWDEEGRMWVGELQTYMRDLDGSGENERMSRVMVLEDTNKVRISSAIGICDISHTEII